MSIQYSLSLSLRGACFFILAASTDPTATFRISENDVFDSTHLDRTSFLIKRLTETVYIHWSSITIVILCIHIQTIQANLEYHPLTPSPSRPLQSHLCNLNITHHVRQHHTRHVQTLLARHRRRSLRAPKSLDKRWCHGARYPRCLGPDARNDGRRCPAQSTSYTYHTHQISLSLHLNSIPASCTTLPQN